MWFSMKIQGFWNFFCSKLSKTHSEFERRTKKRCFITGLKNWKIPPNWTYLSITRFIDTDITATLCRTRISAIDKICYSDLSGLTLCSWQIMKMVQKLVSDDNLDDYLKLNFDPEVLRVLRWIALKQFVMLCILKIDLKPVS